MKHTDGIEMYCPKNQAAWRLWLEKNHAAKETVWFVFTRSPSGKRNVTYDQAVEEALCFGWIDSKSIRLDDIRTLQYFAKRKPRSSWSKLNKERVAKLIAENRMRDAGLAAINVAKQNGSWDALNDVDNLVVPTDLLKALKSYRHALDNFEAFPKSVKRNILEWIHTAKKSETRERRIKETADLAEKNIRAHQ